MKLNGAKEATQFDSRLCTSVHCTAKLPEKQTTNIYEVKTALEYWLKMTKKMQIQAQN